VIDLAQLQQPTLVQPGMHIEHDVFGVTAAEPTGQEQRCDDALADGEMALLCSKKHST